MDESMPLGLPDNAYEGVLFPLSSAVPEGERLKLLAAFDRIASDSLHIDPQFWASRPWIFEGDRGLLLVRQDGDLVGYSIYQRLEVDGRAVLYRLVTNVARAHQGRGVYSLVRRCILPREVQRMSARPLFYAWRTRNPIVWEANAKLCRRVVPVLRGGDPDPDLLALGIAAGKLLYPDLGLDVPSMVMRKAWAAFSYKEAPHHSDAAFDQAFYRGIANVEDAIFAIGELTLPARCGELDAGFSRVLIEDSSSSRQPRRPS